MKFKTLGFFLIFIYSFFINTLNNRVVISPREASPSISQIRRIEPHSEDDIIFKAQGERSFVFYVEDIRDTPPSMKLPLLQRRRCSEAEHKVWKDHYYRGVALERNRVLRL